MVVQTPCRHNSTVGTQESMNKNKEHVRLSGVLITMSPTTLHTKNIDFCDAELKSIFTKILCQFLGVPLQLFVPHKQAAQAHNVHRRLPCYHFSHCHVVLIVELVQEL